MDHGWREYTYSETWSRVEARYSLELIMSGEDDDPWLNALPIELLLWKCMLDEGVV